MTKTAAIKDDALDVLEADHLAFKQMFTAYRTLCDNAAPAAEKRRLAAQICKELLVHARIEEEIFYPELREAIDAAFLLDEAEVEHATAADLIRQISETSSGDDLVDARVMVLGEYIDHHVTQEREQIFVRARQSRLDLVSMADELLQRKIELLEDFEAENA